MASLNAAPWDTVVLHVIVWQNDWLLYLASMYFMIKDDRFIKLTIKGNFIITSNYHGNR